MATYRPNLLVVILPDVAAEAREAVKLWSDTVAGVPTQCMVVIMTPSLTVRLIFSYQKLSKIRSANDQYCTNIALK